MGEGDLQPYTSQTPQPIFMKLEPYNYFPDTTPHAKWVVWANSQFDAWKFLSFFPFLVTPTDHIFGYIHTLNTLLYVIPAKEVTFGVRKIKFDPQKNVKIRILAGGQCKIVIVITLEQ